MIAAFMARRNRGAHDPDLPLAPVQLLAGIVALLC